MLKVGRTYRTIKAGKKFFIHARRNKPASNGNNFIAEDLNTGVVVFFDHKGKHAWDESLTLDIDPYTWVGLVDHTKFSNKEFVKAKDLTHSYPHYLRMESGDPSTITFVDRASFETTYL
jgi:hypothetical protein